MSPRETTAAELKEAGVVPQRPGERMRDAILTRLSSLRSDQGLSREEALQRLFPDIILELPALETLTASLLAGSNILVLGPPGSGKTSLAKAVWDLYPKEVFAVADCPVHDDPMSLVDAAFARVVPPCPYCKAKHGVRSLDRLGEFDVADVDAADVPVRRVRLREGYGFARVQGSPEVFPDNLTGSINLARLEEIGDPMSPLVLEPGKVLQAHRGILLVDEVGKLPRGTQNVLLQALQEGILTPAKSRETFPASVLAVTTSNLADLANITEPLNDRLSNVYVPFASTVAANRRIVDIAMRAERGGVHVPGPFRDAAVHLAMAWRKRSDGTTDLSEVASNRTLIDMLRRAASYALLTGDPTLDPEDLRRGALDAMSGRIRARSDDSFHEHTELLTAFVAKHWRDAGRRGAVDYWCRFFEGELAGDKAEGARVVAAVRDGLAASGGEAERLRALLREQGGDSRVRRFAKYVERAEGVDWKDVPAVLPHVFAALEALGAFEEAPAEVA